MPEISPIAVSAMTISPKGAKEGDTPPEQPTVVTDGGVTVTCAFNAKKVITPNISK